MGRRSSLKPHPLKRGLSERATASHHAIQRATFQHYSALVNDPDHPGQQIPYGELEQQLRARSYRLAATQRSRC
jgi:hypothetical protein